MSFPIFCMLFGMLVFCLETETATPVFLGTPANPSCAVEGKEFTLEWNYALDGSLNAVQFSIVTGGRVDSIGSRIGAGEINSTQKYKARFRAQATSTRAELVIQAVQLSDEATFELTVVSSSGTFISNSAKVIVHSPPSNIVTSSDQNITAPTELTLNCLADGKPKPTITWTRVSDNTNVSMPLNITGGKNEESYRCTADNGVGNPLTKVVKITIQFPPMVTLVQKVLVGREQNASLKCEAKGNPTPTISWSPCDVGNILCNKQYLNISKVQSPRASYTCTATNYLGIDSATTILLIGGKNVSLRLSIDGKCDNNISVWHTLKKELPRVFANTTQNYLGAELLNSRCGSLIFDVVLKFSIEVAEDDIISIIKNAALDGKRGGLSVNVSYLILNPLGAQTTITTPTGTAPKSDDNKTGHIVGAALGSFAFVALIFFICCVCKKKCCNKTKDNTDAAQGRKGEEQDGADEVACPSTSMLPPSKRPVEKLIKAQGQALLMDAQVDKTNQTSNKGGRAQRLPGELQYAEVEHVKSGGSLPENSFCKPMELCSEENALEL